MTNIIVIILVITLTLTCIGICNALKKANTQNLLTKQEIELLLTKTEFLNFKFELHLITHSHVHIAVTAYMCDNDNRAVKGNMTSYHRIELKNTANQLLFLKSLLNCIVEKMRHEASELFKFNGKAILNEHSVFADEKKQQIILTLLE